MATIHELNVRLRLLTKKDQEDLKSCMFYFVLGQFSVTDKAHSHLFFNHLEELLNEYEKRQHNSSRSEQSSMG